jgi:hypothetical protein
MKLSGSLRVCDDFMPDTIQGLYKRPGFQWVSGLIGTEPATWQFVDRDDNEKYLVRIARNGVVNVWDATTGAAQVVNGAASPSIQDYLSHTSDTQLEFFTVGDYTIALNRRVVVQRNPSTYGLDVPYAIITVNIASYNTTYRIRINDTDYSFNTPSTTTDRLTLSDVVNGIFGVLTAAGLTAAVIGPYLYAFRPDGANFSLSASGGVQGNALEAVKGSVASIAQLPRQFLNNARMRVQSGENQDGEDYWVVFKTDGGANTGYGAWEEAPAPGSNLGFLDSTMPHSLVRESNGSWSVVQLTWGRRLVGDNTTNEDPTFVGRTISTVGFFSNRLVLASGSNVICSQTGQYFNFYLSTVQTLVDSDPIDRSAGSVRPLNFEQTLVYGRGLILFSDNGQYSLQTNTDSFSASSAEMVEVGTFDMATRIAPVPLGANVVFGAISSRTAQVFEARFSTDTRSVISELTKSIPKYLPSSFNLLSSSISLDLVTLQSDSEPQYLYVFRTASDGQDRTQAAWFRWSVPFGGVLFHHVSGTRLYVVTRAGNLLHLDLQTTNLTSPLTLDGEPVDVHLDLQASPVFVRQNVGDETTDLFLPYEYSGEVQAVVTAGTNPGRFYTGASQLDPSRPLNSRWFLRVPGLLASSTFRIGIPYTAQAVLPTIYVRSDKAVVTRDEPIVHRVGIDTHRSGPFSATLTALGRDPWTRTFEQNEANLALANTLTMAVDGYHEMPVRARSSQCSITLKAPFPLPVSFVGLQWEGTYSNQGVNPS